MSTSPSITKVAFADDNSFMRDCLDNCLNLWGYSVIIKAWNGKDLLDQISAENMPDVCIVDLEMPVLNGWETIKILSKSWPGIKIMVFSMSVDGKNAKIAGAHIVVSKAAGPNDIKDALVSLTKPEAVLQQ